MNPQISDAEVRVQKAARQIVRLLAERRYRVAAQQIIEFDLPDGTTREEWAADLEDEVQWLTSNPRAVSPWLFKLGEYELKK